MKVALFKRHYALAMFVVMYGLAGNILKDKYPIDFYSAMSFSKFFKVEMVQRDSVWSAIAGLYNKGMTIPYSVDEAPKIPKKFHLIWLGSTPPERYYIIERKLRELHPDFQIKLWTDHDVAQLSLVNSAAYQAATNYGEKSDILRYEILYNEGGIYLDGDFEIFKTFDDLCYAADFFAGLAYDPRMILYNGLIGTAPHHPILSLCMSELGLHGDKNDPESIMERTGPYHFTRCFLKGSAHYDGIIIAFPVTYFYPWPNYEVYSHKQASSWVQDHSLAMHLWARSWTQH